MAQFSLTYSVRVLRDPVHATHCCNARIRITSTSDTQPLSHTREAATQRFTNVHRLGNDFVAFDALCQRVRVNLRGGNLMVKWPSESQPIRMTGPAVSVLEGEIDL